MKTILCQRKRTYHIAKLSACASQRLINATVKMMLLHIKPTFSFRVTSHLYTLIFHRRHIYFLHTGGI